MPNGWLAGGFFGIKLHSSLGEHLFRDGRKHSLGTPPRCRIPRPTGIDIFKRHLNSEPLPGKYFYSSNLYRKHVELVQRVVQKAHLPGEPRYKSTATEFTEQLSR